MSDGRHEQRDRRHDSRKSPRGNHASGERKRKRDEPATLPLKARPLHKTDLSVYRPMFVLYLDVQKQIAAEELSEDELRGRWKSFVGKWNRGELAEGWYDPITLQKAQRTNHPQASSSDEDDYGPRLPGQTQTNSGPAQPGVQDLILRRDLEHDHRAAQQEQRQQERKHDRRTQKERLDELVPRAEAGSRERMLENKQERASANRAFAQSKTEASGGMQEVADGELLGDGGDSIAEIKQLKQDQERKKNERELRREAQLRERAAEREDRVREYREKEAKTMSSLVALAKARFG